MELYIHHLNKLREDFEIHIGDLDNIHVHEWLAIAFDMKIDNKGYESDVEDERIEMHVDLKAKTLFKSKNLAEY